jgi:hypothetical protein
VFDGDIAVVKQQPGASNGEVVAAIVDGEATKNILIAPAVYGVIAFLKFAFQFYCIFKKSCLNPQGG